MEQASEEGFVALLVGETLRLGNAAGSHGNPQTMFPEIGGISLFVGLVDAESLQAENKTANNLNPDELDGFGRTYELAGNTELSGIDDLKQLGGYAEVCLHHFSDIVQGGIS